MSRFKCINFWEIWKNVNITFQRHLKLFNLICPPDLFRLKRDLINSNNYFFQCTTTLPDRVQFFIRFQTDERATLSRVIRIQSELSGKTHNSAARSNPRWLATAAAAIAAESKVIAHTGHAQHAVRFTHNLPWPTARHKSLTRGDSSDSLCRRPDYSDARCDPFRPERRYFTSFWQAGWLFHLGRGRLPHTCRFAGAPRKSSRPRYAIGIRKDPFGCVTRQVPGRFCCMCAVSVVSHA